MDDGKRIKKDDNDPDHGQPELYEPKDIEILINNNNDNADIYSRESSINGDLVEDQTTRQNLLKHSGNEEYYLKFCSDDSGVNSWYESNNNQYTTKIYASFFHDQAEDKVILSYWFYYLYNNDEDLDKIQHWYDLVDLTNHHLSDWEGMSIVFNRNGNYLIPDFAATSSHISIGTQKPWNNIHKIENHPIVFICNGSHATYFVPGRSRNESPELIALLGDEYTDFHYGKGKWILPRDVQEIHVYHNYKIILDLFLTTIV